MASDAASVAKTIASINARGSSIILNLESDRWETRASTLDLMGPRDVEENVMLVLERVEDEDQSVRNAAAEALKRSPRALRKHSNFVALKLHNNNREIQKLGLELLAALDAGSLSQYLKKVCRLENDLDPRLRDAVKRIRLKCEEYNAGVEAAAAAKAAREQEREEERRKAEAARQRKPTAGQQSGPYRVAGRTVPAR